MHRRVRGGVFVLACVPDICVGNIEEVVARDEARSEAQGKGLRRGKQREDLPILQACSDMPFAAFSVACTQCFQLEY